MIAFLHFLFWWLLLALATATIWACLCYRRPHIHSGRLMSDDEIEALVRELLIESLDDANLEIALRWLSQRAPSATRRPRLDRIQLPPDRTAQTRAHNE